MRAAEALRLPVQSPVGHRRDCRARMFCAARSTGARRRRPGESPGDGRRRSAGFTLLEILVSLVLVGSLMAAMTFFIFSMGELWGKTAQDRLFERHARGLTRYLQSTMSQSLIGASDQDGGLQLRQPSGFGHFDDPLISFELLESPPILVWPERPLPAVVCYLQLVEKQGLYLLWHSRLEIDFDEAPPRTTLLSPFVTEMIFDYYDPEIREWSSYYEYEVEEGEPVLPSRIRLGFEHDGMTEQTVITLPRSHGNVVLF